MHLRLHLVTLAVYASPASTISTRLLLCVLEDLLLPQAYPAELAGSSYSLDSEQGGLLLRLVGFPGVVQQLLGLVLRGLLGEWSGCRHCRAAGTPSCCVKMLLS